MPTDPTPRRSTVLGLAVESPVRERGVIGAVGSSPSGNVLLRVGHRLAEAGGWTQTEHVVLDPSERDDLVASLLDPRPDERIRSAADLQLMPTPPRQELDGEVNLDPYTEDEQGLRLRLSQQIDHVASIMGNMLDVWDNQRFDLLSLDEYPWEDSLDEAVARFRVAAELIRSNVEETRWQSWAVGDQDECSTCGGRIVCVDPGDVVWVAETRTETTSVWSSWCDRAGHGHGPSTARKPAEQELELPND